MTYEFDTSNFTRVKLPERLIRMAVKSHLRASSKTNGKGKPWSPKEVVDVCELYISGWKPIEIQREILPHRKQGLYVRKWADVFGKERAYSKYVHEQNRLNNILGKEAVEYDYNPMDPQTDE